MCSARGLPCTRIGVTDGTSLDVQDLFDLPLEELSTAYESTLPALFGALAGGGLPTVPSQDQPAPLSLG